MVSREKSGRAEHRWPAAIALIVALALYALLPSSFFEPLRYVVVGLGLLLLIPVLAVNPLRMHRQTRWSRALSVGQTLLLLIANQVALIQLINQLISSSKDDGPHLLLAALQVWVTNVIVFALLYWEIDRGGAVARSTRSRKDLPPADFRFPQDEDHDAVEEVAVRSSNRLNWTASFIDYLYFSLSNSMAFSPTDTMPLSHRAKALMGLQSFAGFVILALVIARAVSLLG
ncbi:MAG: hypothetical protein ACOH1U_06280 [Rhodoglobus sp.]